MSFNQSCCLTLSRERYPGAAQAAVQGDDRLEACAAGRPERAGAQLHTERTESNVDLAIVLDLFNREIVGWSIKPRMTADIVTDTLTMAWFRRKPGPGLIHHSDRGSQPGLNWSSQHGFALLSVALH